MATELADAHIRAKQHLQRVIAAAVASAWAGLGRYDQDRVDRWLETVLPLTAAANRQAVALTQAFIARALRTAPPSLDTQQVIDGIRNGATPQQVYARPFVTVWAALGRGTPWGDAVQMGSDRATAAAVTDVQLSFTHTLRSIGSYDGRIAGWERVPDASACDFCSAAAGQIYHTGNLLPLHTWCGCGCEPVLADSGSPIDSFAPEEFDAADGTTVAVRDHGELGPLLTNAADKFTGPSAIPAAAS